MKNGEKSEIFDEKWRFPRIYPTCRGFWSKMVGVRVGWGEGFGDFPGFYEVSMEKAGDRRGGGN